MKALKTGRLRSTANTLIFTGKRTGMLYGYIKSKTVGDVFVKGGEGLNGRNKRE